jgi:4'-phosphopantetheinyl transferase
MCNPSVLLTSLEREAHISIAFTEKHYNRDLLAWYKSLLSEYEQKKYNELYFGRHRESYLISRALLRTTLSLYIDAPPAELEFSYDSYGRPEIQKPVGISGIRFNLSRTRGVATCLISSSTRAGIDVESTLNLSDPEIMFRSVLLPKEIESLQGLRGNSLKRRFLTYWTLKEAYVKATGKGLSIPLTQFSFKLKDGYAQVSFGPQLTDNPLEWQFAYYGLTHEHILAVALRKMETTDKNIKIFKVIPSSEHHQPWNNYSLYL